MGEITSLPSCAGEDRATQARGGGRTHASERTASADGDSKVGQEVYYDVECVETVMIESRRDEKSACERDKFPGG